MQRYNVELSKQALKYYLRLDRILRSRIDEILGDFEMGEFEKYDVEVMQGEPRGTFRLRFGGFRMIFERQDSYCYIFVIKIGPRGDVYK